MSALRLSTREPYLNELLRRLTPILSAKPTGKPWIPADPRPLFEPAHVELQEIYASLSGADLRETQTKNELWLEMLRTASMEPENEVSRHRLFVTHSFLIALARGVIRTLANPRQQSDASAALNDGFVSWILSTEKGRDWADALFSEIHRFEWRRQPGDVLRPLYERFVDARDRKTFGEYYTPDWLAELLVEQVLDEAWCETAAVTALKAETSQEELSGTGVLDPTCGSGTFLYHAARRLLSTPVLSDVAAPQRAAVVSRLVVGIDVHPVAAEISRATLLRALPSEPPSGEAAIRVYVGDSLLANTFDEDSLFRRLNGEVRVSTPGGRYVSIPQSFIEQPDFSDNLRRMIAAAATNQKLPTDIAHSVPTEDRTTLRECFEAFQKIIASEGNSVWTWYIANTAGPFRLREQKVDRIIANPPWVSMTDIQVLSRKRSLEQFADDPMGLWTGGRNAPHFDISQLFIKRCREVYLANPDCDPAAWLVKKSALFSGSWQKFREWHSRVLAQTLDLEDLRPFGGGDARRCCVLFEGRHSSILPNDSPSAMYAAIEAGKLTPDMSIREAETLLSFHVSAPPLPMQMSGYVDEGNRPAFRQGATITPKVLTIIERTVTTGRSGELSVTTSHSQKEPWGQVSVQQGVVPDTWVHNLLSSNEVYVFGCARELPQAIIPTDEKQRLVANPELESDFWYSLDQIYQEHRGQGRNTPVSLMAQIDYSGKLSSQLTKALNRKTLVLHPTSGDIMRAARSQPGHAIIQHTLHYYRCETAKEAAYLVALLNAPCLARAFKQCRTSGRHFTNNPWRSIPIAKYDKTNPSHRRLATLCRKAELIVENWLEDQHAKLGQIAASTRIRDMLHEIGILDSIDAAARLILPEHTD